jgi:hypothetical protein
VGLLALLSFGLGSSVAAFGGDNTWKSVVTGALVMAYATPVLFAWPGAWLAWRSAATREVTFDSSGRCLKLGGGRLSLEEVVGLRSVHAPWGAVLLLTPRDGSTSVALELRGLPKAEISALLGLEAFGLLRLSVRRRRVYAHERLAFGTCAALLTVCLGEWGLTALFFLGPLLVPTLWTLMILDMTGWSAVEVGEGALLIDGKRVPMAPSLIVKIEPERLVLSGLVARGEPKIERISFWSHEGARGRRHLLVVAAAINAAIPCGTVG